MKKRQQTFFKLIEELATSTAFEEVMANMNEGFLLRLQIILYSKSYSEGWGDYTNNDVETITGHPSRSFQQFFDEVMSWGFKQPVKAKEDLVVA